VLALAGLVSATVSVAHFSSSLSFGAVAPDADAPPQKMSALLFKNFFSSSSLAAIAAPTVPPATASPGGSFSATVSVAYLSVDLNVVLGRFAVSSSQVVFSW